MLSVKTRVTSLDSDNVFRIRGLVSLSRPDGWHRLILEKAYFLDIISNQVWPNTLCFEVALLVRWYEEGFGRFFRSFHMFSVDEE